MILRNTSNPQANIQNMISNTRLLLLSFLLCGLLPAGGQDAVWDRQDAQTVEKKDFNERVWRESTKGLDYWLKQQEEAKKRRESEERKGGGVARERRRASSGNAGPVMKVVLILLLAVAAAFVIRALIRMPRDKKLRKAQRNWTVENLEEDLLESELDGFIREALAAEDYALALRLYYLKLLQLLHQRHLIRWKKDKTNREYLREMRPTPHYDSFRDLTMAFERVRYGGQVISAGQFREIEPRFIQLLKKV